MPFEHTIPHQPWEPNHPRTIINSMDVIPDFANECEEHKFWSTHELADELWDNAEPLPADVEQALERARQARRARRP